MFEQVHFANTTTLADHQTAPGNLDHILSITTERILSQEVLATELELPAQTIRHFIGAAPGMHA